MASSMSSLGPPMTGPGNSAPSVGFAVCATTRRGVCFNKEQRSGNTLCHKNNVERSYAIHENRLASVKASLSVSTPLRLDFVDKRLSKNFHLRRHHEQVVSDNLKLLRALEKIQSRTSSTASCIGLGDSVRGSPSPGGRKLFAAGGGGGSATVPLGAKKSLTVSATSAGKSYSSSMLNTLLERKRSAKSALVARENQKMSERLARSKSLYSRDKMRKHRLRHQRFSRLRKTDYTAGHLLTATTAMRHWTGGSSRDEGFAYSFEEGNHRHCHRPGKRSSNRTGGERGNNSGSLSTVSHPGGVSRGASHSPAGVKNNNKRLLRGNSAEGNHGGVKSAPRLPSLFDADGIYNSGNVMGCPHLERSLLAAGIPARFSGGAAGSSGGSPISSTTGSVGGGRGGNRERLRPSTDTGVGSRRGVRRDRRGKGVGGGGSGGSERARGASAGSDSLMFNGRGSLGSAGEDGSRGRGDRVFKGEDRGGQGGWNNGASLPALRESTAELDRIFNPLAFPDEKKGVRVLIQATKPLEVLNHVGETWICFVRIMTKEPFDNQLDIRIIHDREEVCSKVVSLEEATAICEGAGRTAEEYGRFPPLASSAELLYSKHSTSSSGGEADDGGSGGGGALGTGGREGEEGGALKRCSISDGNFADFLMGLFAEVDTDGKGSLTPEQLTSIMRHAELGLTGPELQLVIAEADENADGNIEYYEFIPMAYNLINAFRARRRACEEVLDESLDLDQQALYALYDADFDRMVRQLKDLCKSFDPKGNGVIPRADFKQCISSERCGGLTKIESKLLLNLLPKDPQGNVFYRKLGAGLEQVRFTTLRNTAAEAAATDTQKYLMDLCREEDAIATGGKQYSGVLRARQLTKLLLNAPLLSLSRLHVTAVMSQAHIVDGMVNYVELAPIMAKTIEGIFHPRSLKMRHEMVKTHGVGGGGGGATSAGGSSKGSGGTGGSGLELLQLQGSTATATVRGKTREEVQKLFVDVLRNENQGASIERLKDPETFAKCLTSLGLDLEPDTINALWVAADVDGREGTTFVDVVDFCFSYVLFVEREKQVKHLQRTLSSTPPDPQSDLSDLGSPGTAAGRVEAAAAAAVAAAAAAAAAATSATGDAPAAKQDPLLVLARALVRHIKVTSPAEGQVGLEFLDDSQIVHDVSNPRGMLTLGHDHTLSRKQRAGKDGDEHLRKDLGPELASSSSDEYEDVSGDDDDNDYGDADNPGATGGNNCSRAREGDDREGGGGGARTTTSSAMVEEDGRLTSSSAAAQEVTIILRTRRKVPVVGPSGQPITTLKPLSKGTLKTDDGASKTIEDSPPEAQHRGKESDSVSGAPSLVDSSLTPSVEPKNRSSSSGLEVEDPRGEAQDMVVKVYWEGAARDRAYVDAYPAKVGGKRRKGSKGSSSSAADCHHNRHLRLSVRVPTLAIVDALAAVKFAERVAQQIAIQVEGDTVWGVARDGHHQQEERSKRATRLRLVGVDAKAVFVMK